MEKDLEKILSLLYWGQITISKAYKMILNLQEDKCKCDWDDQIGETIISLCNNCGKKIK